MIKKTILASVILFSSIILWQTDAFSQNKKAHVIYISIDGLRSDALQKIDAGQLPNFNTLIREGVSTLNARPDHDITITLPNHTSMLTARRVLGEQGHNITFNDDNGKTLAEINGRYIQSIFDVIKGAKLSTGFFVSKDKFNFLARSFGVVNYVGKSEEKPTDNGNIDYFYNSYRNDQKTLDKFLKVFDTNPLNFTFVHFASPDVAGHGHGWLVDGDTDYTKAIKFVDTLLGVIIKTARALEKKGDAVYLIITTDHGGDGYVHSNPYNESNYTIPFIVWGSGVAKGQDLYALNQETRQEPGTKRIDPQDESQPIRNSDGANLALKLLQLEPINGSTVNFKQDLAVKQL